MLTTKQLSELFFWKKQGALRFRRKARKLLKTEGAVATGYNITASYGVPETDSQKAGAKLFGVTQEMFAGQDMSMVDGIVIIFKTPQAIKIATQLAQEAYDAAIKPIGAKSDNLTGTSTNPYPYLPNDFVWVEDEHKAYKITVKGETFLAATKEVYQPREELKAFLDTEKTGEAENYVGSTIAYWATPLNPDWDYFTDEMLEQAQRDWIDNHSDLYTLRAAFDFELQNEDDESQLFHKMRSHTAVKQMDDDILAELNSKFNVWEKDDRGFPFVSASKLKALAAKDFFAFHLEYTEFEVFYKKQKKSWLDKTFGGFLTILKIAIIAIAIYVTAGAAIGMMGASAPLIGTASEAAVAAGFDTLASVGLVDVAMGVSTATLELIGYAALAVDVVGVAMNVSSLMGGAGGGTNMSSTPEQEVAKNSADGTAAYGEDVDFVELYIERTLSIGGTL